MKRGSLPARRRRDAETRRRGDTEPGETETEKDLTSFVLLVLLRGSFAYAAPKAIH